MTGLSDYLRSLNRDGWSLRRISQEAQKHGHQINYTTVRKYINGEHGTPSTEVLEALAAAFRVDVNDVRAAAGRPSMGEPFELTPEASRLTGPQRDAVRRVVQQFIEANDAVADRPVRDGATTDEDDDIYGLAALERPSRGKAMKRADDRLGEESQDHGSEDPA